MSSESGWSRPLHRAVCGVGPGDAGRGNDQQRFLWDDDGSVHEGFIEAIAAEGITLGCATNLYCPYDPITRAQMASFLDRAFDLRVRRRLTISMMTLATPTKRRSTA